MSKLKKINYFDELVLTFSTKKSLFSSKKIERFIVFNTFLIITIVYISLNIKSMSATEFIEIIGLWLVYGGYNSAMTIRDRKLDNPSESTSESTSEEESEVK